MLTKVKGKERGIGEKWAKGTTFPITRLKSIMDVMYTMTIINTAVWYIGKLLE